jgi:Trypsin-like peptidase domain
VPQEETLRWGSEQDGAFVSDLRGLYLQSRPSFLYGVGTWFGPGVDRPRPLFVVDEHELTITPLAATAEETSLLGGLVVGTPESVSERAKSVLSGWLDSAVVIPSSPPQALARVGSVLLDAATNERGTVGVPVERTDGRGTVTRGILTAGHVVTAKGEVLNSWPLLPYRGKRLGRVSLWSDPLAPAGSTSVPGVDLAVIDLDEKADPISPVSSGVARLPSSPPQPIPVVVHRGFKPNGYGTIVAALITCGAPHRQWSDCWILTPGLAQDGDSGAAVATLQGQLVGMLVGGATQGRPSNVNHHYVQDHDSVERSLLAAAGIRLK